MNNFKILPLLLSLILFTNRFTFAQTDSIPIKKFTFGVAGGYIQGAYKIKKANWEASGLADTLSGISNKSNGSSLALQLNYNINTRLALRAQAGFYFDAIKITFLREDGKNKIYSFENLSLSLPIDLVYTFQNVKSKPAVLLGMRYMKEIQSPIKYRQSARYMSLLPHDLGFEVGGNLTINRRKFILKPEISYYFSPFNILKFENLYMPFKAIRAINRNFIDFRLSFLR
jgi:hypothetical protein